MTENLNLTLFSFQIPSDAIDVIMNDFPALQNTIENLMTANALPKKSSSSIREYLCYKAYLDAQEGFAEWFSHYHHNRPTPVPEVPPYATFTDKVAYEHKTELYKKQLERWQTTMQHHTEV